MAIEDRADAERLARREREKLARREEILEAARRVFAAQGFHAATLEEIAAEAKYSKGALYGYFEGKEDLYASLLEEEFDRITSGIRRAMVEHQDPLDVLREAIRLKLRHHAERRDLFAEMGKGQARLTVSHDSGDHVGWRLRNRFRKRFLEEIDLLVELLERGARLGKLRADIPPKHLATNLLGLVHSSFFYWLANGESEPVEAVSDRVIKFFMDGARSQTEGQ